jgi:hypothetical protein
MFLAQDTSTSLPVSHADVPFRRAPRYLRLTTTVDRALDYAAGGFHVSVTRAEGGGCSDAAGSISATRASSCMSPLNREDSRGAWVNAAMAYSYAFMSGGTVDEIKLLLDKANQAADAAYTLENVEPPRDPVLVAAGVYAPPEPVTKKLNSKMMAGIGLAAVAIAGGLAYASQKPGGLKRLVSF